MVLNFLFCNLYFNQMYENDHKYCYKQTVDKVHTMICGPHHVLCMYVCHLFSVHLLQDMEIVTLLTIRNMCSLKLISWRVGRSRFCLVVCKNIFSDVFRMIYQQERCEVCAPLIEADINENFGGRTGTF